MSHAHDRFDKTRPSGTAPAPILQTLLLETDAVALVERALADLERSRALIVHRELEGLSYQELAAVMGIPIGTVTSSLSQVRDAFRDALDRRLTSPRRRINEVRESSNHENQEDWMRTLHVLAASTPLLFAIACGDSSPPASPSPAPPPGGAASSVTIPVGASALGNRAFNPGEVEIAIGGTVRWVNADTVSHTSTSNASGWDSGTIASGREFSSTFRAAGAFPYHCAIHPGMVGTVVVR